MEHLLLNLDDFGPYCELPENMRFERMAPHILAAQRQLRPLLGEPLYAELSRRHETNSLSGDYLELHALAVPALVHAALASFWPFSQTTLTSAGLRQKTSQYSEPVDARTLAAQATIYDGRALTYEVELRAWLIVTADSFAGFYPSGHCEGPSVSRSSSVVMQAITAPSYGGGRY
ncbi:hypothetical protein D0N36_06960 [Hymenobacter lapidiphilus]|uniref:DUF6712 family protein n=1 Tax=Hymenobacter sp. CCM 8763 TaxID=2303334 RepID=UPI000E353BD7|nr:hypothetical protein [Hymenobacter sp. CCM 8763]RFP65938.1 hypothetical protein D0N36_06960 [Hymenobacter sp. CCM 8763]